MQKHLSKIMQSFVVFPILTASFALNPVSGVTAGFPTAAAIFSDQNRTLSSETAANQQLDLEKKAAKVDAFFAQYDRPAEGYGLALVKAAQKYGLPDYSIAAILQVESSGLAHSCPNNKANGFGYGSCDGVHFDSVEEAIDTVAKTLAGKSAPTARFYEGKDFTTRLNVYNGYANSKYVMNINWVMDKIDNMNTTPDVAMAN